MAAQGNPKLYARQKAKHLTLSLLAVELHPIMIQIQQIFAPCDDPLSPEISGLQTTTCC